MTFVPSRSTCISDFNGCREWAMSKCDLLVQLADDATVVRPGGRVTGHVEVRSDDGCTVRRLVLRSEWRTHGRGTRNTGDVEEQVLAEQLIVRRGDVEQLPFAVDIPETGPLTYHGELVNVDWYIRATADLAWRRDPTAEAEVLVRGGDDDAATEPAPPTLRATRVAELPAGTLDRLHQLAQPVEEGAFAPARTAGARLAAGGCALLFFLPFMVLLISTGISLVRDGGVLAVGGVVLIVLMLAPPLAFASKAHELWLLRQGQRLLGTPELRVHAPRARRGDVLDWSLCLAPLQPVEIGGVHATLAAEESATHGSGTSRRTYQHTAIEYEALYESPGRLAAGEQLLYAGRFPIPHDAPVVFKASDNSVLWWLQVTLSVRGRPVWRRRVQVVVDSAPAVPA
jgi:hypothetical protein